MKLFGLEVKCPKLKLSCPVDNFGNISWYKNKSNAITQAVRTLFSLQWYNMIWWYCRLIIFDFTFAAHKPLHHNNFTTALGDSALMLPQCPRFHQSECECKTSSSENTKVSLSALGLLCLWLSDVKCNVFLCDNCTYQKNRNKSIKQAIYLSPL